MSKKIGVATLGNAQENYGQIMQAYALQEFLRQKGYDPFLINYHRKFTLADEKGLRKIAKAIYLFSNNIFAKNKNVENNKSNTDNTPEDQRKSDFKKFYVENFKFSEKAYSTFKEIKQTPPEADVLIAGSDQIWNWAGRYGYDKIYFLQFGGKNTTRITYAAGMSKIEHSKRVKKELKEYLKKLDFVSLREPTGKSLLEESGCKKVNVVLDPTLLLEKEHYLSISDSKSPSNKKFVLGYFINFENQEDIYWSTIQDYLSKTDVDFNYVSSEGYYNSFKELGGYKNQYYSVKQWLAAYNDTSFVLTSSYHGLLFSIIMNKPFLFFFIEGSKHAYGKNRALHILDELGLTNRIYNPKSSQSFAQQLEAPIDWKSVNNKLDILRKNSVDFLINSIEYRK